jgi:hypothetical protein
LAKPLHVLPFLLPQSPLVLMLPEPLLHVPKADWQPEPQNAVSAPQYPEAEQHSPFANPLQVFPFLPPHSPFVEILPEPLVQVPKPVWQPALQKSLPLPQYPEELQHSPLGYPLHVLPFSPHCPSVEMLPASVLHVPNPDWQPALQKSLPVPQYPEELQHSPLGYPLHVLPFFPHWPSVETSLAPSSQVPKPDWQPAPQKSPPVPQYPEELQQLPLLKPRHVFPLEPQEPSVVTFCEEVSQVPKRGWQPAPQKPSSSPQYPEELQHSPLL